MTTYSKYNFVYRLQKWMDSVPGQTFLNYAYSWGASIVILGTLFKLTHLPGANFFLFLGMGTEVFVFFISAFDRPFDKTTDGMELDTHVVTDEDTVEGAAAPATVIGGNGGTIIIGGGVGPGVPGQTSQTSDSSEPPLVYDLYTGTGTIANFVAKKARKVIGIEYVPEAIEDAKVNSAINGITNTLFFAGDMKDILNEDFIAEHGRPDVIITDPPRAGMHPDVVKTILGAAPQRIVYVSCNPATQARDLQAMDSQYKVIEVQPVDMFPHTPHVENVVLLERR